MKHKLKNLLVFFLKCCTVLLIGGCLIVSLLPWIGNGKLWFFHILGLGFPVLIVLLVFFTAGWFIARSRWRWVCLITVLLSGQQISYLFAFHTGSRAAVHNENTLRVLSWNVCRWDEGNKEMRGGVSFRTKMFDYIREQQPDVLCLQEFFDCSDPKFFDANIPVLQSMGYSYYHFYPVAVLFDGIFRTGLAVFSKYPIVESKDFDNGIKVHSEGLLYSDIVFKNKRIRFFNAHFETPGLREGDFSGGGMIQTGKHLLRKIADAYAVRTAQVNEAAAIIRKSPWPVVLCADLGDVPNSYAYSTLRGELKDAFLRAGSGFGPTFEFIMPTLRIDYTFITKQVKIRNFQNPATNLSDHRPFILNIEVD